MKMEFTINCKINGFKMDSTTRSVRNYSGASVDRDDDSKSSTRLDNLDLDMKYTYDFEKGEVAELCNMLPHIVMSVMDAIKSQVQTTTSSVEVATEQKMENNEDTDTVESVNEERDEINSFLNSMPSMTMDELEKMCKEEKEEDEEYNPDIPVLPEDPDDPKRFCEV